MILVSEFGDKTFFIAAIMSMKQPRFIVFCGSFSALVLMTILSAGLGFAVPNLLPKVCPTLLHVLRFQIAHADLSNLKLFHYKCQIFTSCVWWGRGAFLGKLRPNQTKNFKYSNFCSLLFDNPWRVVL